MPVRALLVDSDATTRARLAGMLTAAGVTLVGQVAEWSVVADEAMRTRPHVVLVDLTMPAHGAVRALEAILRHRLAPAVCMLAPSEAAVAEQADDLVTAVQLGARGYLLKDAPQADIAVTVRTLTDGGTAISPEFARDLVTAFDYPLLDQIAFQQRTPPATPAPQHALDGDERRILLLIALGLAHDEIARRLTTSEQDIQVHLRSVLNKVGFRPNRPPDPLGAGVPRRPPPGGLIAAAAATPESDPR